MADEITSPDQSEEVSTSATEQPTNSLPETSPEVKEEQSPELNQTFAKLKKEFREKGRQEGYNLARTELEAATLANTESKSEMTPAPLTSQDMYAATQAALGQERVERMRTEGLQKYPDFQTKVQEFLTEAQHDQELNALGEAAVKAGNVDAFYKLISDEKTLTAIREKNPRLWASEISKLTKKDNGSVVMKNNAPPVEEIKAPPATSTGKRSLIELRKRARTQTQYRNK